MTSAQPGNITVVVNCQWPCPGTDTVCILTRTSVQCGPRENSQWILDSPTHSPVFRGETVHLNQPCVVVPMPSLPTASSSKVLQPNQTRIMWPPTGNPSRPMDGYLSDCDEETYCDNGMCVARFGSNEPCKSSNQCFGGECVDQQCRTSALPKMSPHSHSNVVVILTSILAAVALLLLVAAYLRRRRQQLRQQPHQKLDLGHTPPPSPPIAYHGELRQDHAENSPSMQQLQLQAQLHHQHLYVHTLPSPPPPYTP